MVRLLGSISRTAGYPAGWMMEGLFAITFLFGGGTLFLLSMSPVGRALAERIRGRNEPAHDPELLAEVDALRHEVAELHERVDFAERILMKTQDRHELGQGEHS
jgi:hypothetical protein